MDRKFYSGVDEDGKPKDAIVKYGPSFARDHASGTGPYKVVVRDQGIQMVFKRFDA